MWAALPCVWGEQRRPWNEITKYAVAVRAVCLFGVDGKGKGVGGIEMVLEQGYSNLFLLGLVTRCMYVCAFVCLFSLQKVKFGILH